MASETSGARRYGVLIASSTFPEEPKLRALTCPPNDVDGLSVVLGDAAIGGFADVVVIKDEPSHQVLRKVHAILRQAGRDDLVLIYYAGHGKLDRAGRLHLATVDTTNAELETTSVPAQRIRDLIDTADTTKVALILDCCYSGAVDKSFLRSDVSDQLNLVAGGRGTFIMTASTDVQTAREEVRDGYGIFTKHLIDGMRGAADVDGDGVVTMNELYSYVHREVLAESHQVPMKWSLNVEGELVISRTGRKPREERRLALRTRLFELADAGMLPDEIFAKALEVSNLSHEETRSGAAKRYDVLLDRVLAEDLRIGEFIGAWLRIPPDDAPVPEPTPAPQERRGAAAEPQAAPREEDDGVEPALPPDWPLPAAGWFWRLAVHPYPATQQNLDRHPLYRLVHRREVTAREMARLGAREKPRASWSDAAVCIGWFLLGIPLFGAFAQAFGEENISYFHSGSLANRTDHASGGLTIAAIWVVLGWNLQRRARYRTGKLVKGIYWVGIAGYTALGGTALIAALDRL